MLRLLGVRYVISSESGPICQRLLSDPNFRLIGSTQYYFRVFEYRNARPPFGWEDESGDRRVEPRELTPERREFAVRSSNGGRFTLDEQFLPGWQASIDGRSVPIERWKGAFQAIQVPPGEHTIQFRFRSKGLRIGAWISLLSLIALVVCAVVIE